MIQRQHRLNVMSEQFIDKAIIKGEARFVDFSSAEGEHARPTYREAICVEPHLGH